MLLWDVAPKSPRAFLNGSLLSVAWARGDFHVFKIVMIENASSLSVRCCAGTRLVHSWEPELCLKSVLSKGLHVFVTPKVSALSCEVAIYRLFHCYHVLKGFSKLLSLILLSLSFHLPWKLLLLSRNVFSTALCCIPMLYSSALIMQGCNSWLIHNLQFVLLPKIQRSPAGDRTYWRHVSLQQEQ